jgi:hypothetical protein
MTSYKSNLPTDMMDQWQRCKPATFAHPAVIRLGVQPSGWRCVPALLDEADHNIDWCIDEKPVTGWLVGLMTDHQNKASGLCLIPTDPQEKPLFYPHYGAYGSLTLGKPRKDEPLLAVTLLNDGIALQNAGGAVRVVECREKLTHL